MNKETDYSRDPLEGTLEALMDEIPPQQTDTRKLYESLDLTLDVLRKLKKIEHSVSQNICVGEAVGVIEQDLSRHLHKLDRKRN